MPSNIHATPDLAMTTARALARAYAPLPLAPPIFFQRKIINIQSPLVCGGLAENCSEHKRQRSTVTSVDTQTRDAAQRGLRRMGGNGGLVIRELNEAAQQKKQAHPVRSS
jgi:hypothetical protein